MGTYSIELDHETEVPIIVEGVRLLKERWEQLLMEPATAQLARATTPATITEVVRRCNALLERFPKHGLNV